MSEGKVGTILAPPRLPSVPVRAQWLGGTGAGTWFSLFETTENNIYRIQRHNPAGVLEIDDLFVLEQHGFLMNSDYCFTYVSNAIKCNVLQGEKKYQFINLKKFEK